MSLFGGRRRDGGSEPAETPGSGAGGVAPQAPFAAPAPRSEPERKPFSQTSHSMGAPLVGGGESMANIGKSIVIKGDLTGEEDLVIEGKVEGKVHLPKNRLTIGQTGNVTADVHAQSVVVIGRVAGNISAGERLEIQATGIVEGDVRAPRLSVQEGAVMNGSIEMSTKDAPVAAKPASGPTLAPAPTPAATGERRTG